jgi:hypothetical protein
MDEHSVIVWDLETVPDLAAAARMLNLGDAPEADVRQALGSGFPKHPLRGLKSSKTLPLVSRVSSYGRCYLLWT